MTITRYEPSKQIEERFWAKVDKVDGDGCWVWTGALREGYGEAWFNGKLVQAHRVAFELLIGPIPADREIDHLCRNRLCVNPAHLEVVTHQQNTLRGEGPTAQHARAIYCPKGHPYDLLNTYFRSTGRRGCRACGIEREKQRKRIRHILVGLVLNRLVCCAGAESERLQGTVSRAGPRAAVELSGAALEPLVKGENGNGQTKLLRL